MSKIDFGGITKTASLAYVPECVVGDYVIVHVGFAISRVDEAEAAKVFEYKRERRELEDALSPDYHIMLPDPARPLEAHFDLAMIDGTSLKQLRPVVESRRKADEPVLLPFLLITHRRKDNVPSKHLGRIVDDLILRPADEKELRARVRNLIRMRHWSLELKKEHDRVMRLAVTDDVSGFHNTRYLHRFLDRFLEASSGKPRELCLVFFDLDNFKRLVDEHGHLLGSKALKEVAQTVSEVLEPDDRLVRYGGDEFIVLLPRQSKPEALVKVQRMQEAIATANFLQKEGVNARLTASFGLAAFPEDAQDKRELLARADQCLFRSKTSGKARITIAEEAAPFNPLPLDHAA